MRSSILGEKGIDKKLGGRKKRREGGRGIQDLKEYINY
jgi:hypothetical protein